MTSAASTMNARDQSSSGSKKDAPLFASTRQGLESFSPRPVPPARSCERTPGLTPQAVTAKLRQLGEHRDQRVVGALERKGVEVVAVPVGHRRAAPGDLEVRCAQEQVVKTRDRLLSHMTLRGERVEPVPGVGVEQALRRGHGGSARHRLC
jgi:hypothetical protein